MLNADAWQSRVKALIVISKLVQSSSFDKVSSIDYSCIALSIRLDIDKLSTIGDYRLYIC